MNSDYDIVGTKFLGVFPLNLYRLDHGIGPCNVSTNLSGGYIQAIVWGAEWIASRCWTADASIGIIADILYMKMNRKRIARRKCG
jgi:hypothetical protein